MNKFDFNPEGCVTTYPIDDNITLRIRNIDYAANEVIFCDENGNNITGQLNEEITIKNEFNHNKTMNHMQTYILEWATDNSHSYYVETGYEIYYKGNLVITIKPQRQWLIEYHKKEVVIKKAMIVATLETSNHDGYCTDNECEYDSRMVTHFVEIPKEYEDHPLGTIDHSNYPWKDLLPEPRVQGNSCYCSCSIESRLHQLDIHDYRYTIESVDLVSWTTDKKPSSPV